MPRLISIVLLLLPVLAVQPAVAAEPVAAPPIKAFCIDFNWGPKGINGFAGPGVWADASPEEHVRWYEGLGANVIQTFAVSCNGYAWYKGGIAPPQPGLKYDFLTDVVRLGHAKGMRVMGYYCVGANTLWGQQHPDLSYGTPSAPHIPLTTAYLDYLCRSMEDALRRTGMDGFMIDWARTAPCCWGKNTGRDHSPTSVTAPRESKVAPAARMGDRRGFQHEKQRVAKGSDPSVDLLLSTRL